MLFDRLAIRCRGEEKRTYQILLFTLKHSIQVLGLGPVSVIPAETLSPQEQKRLRCLGHTFPPVPSSTGPSEGIHPGICTPMQSLSTTSM